MTQDATLRPRLLLVTAQLTAALSPQLLIPSLTAGLVAGAIGTIRAISYAALIFSGSLSEHLATGIGLTVFSTGLISAIAGLTSALPGMIVTPLAAPTAILALMASDLAARLGPGAASETVWVTVVMAIALSALLTGALLLTLGRVQLGNAIRLVPYPVVGGFMAGTGWLLVDGFFQVTCDQPLTWATLPALGQPEALAHWSLGLLFTLLLLGAAHRFQHYWVMPGTLLGLVVAFYGLLLAQGQPLAVARAQGWLLGPFPEGGLWQPLGWGDLGAVQWSAIASQSGSLLAVAAVSLLSLVLSNSAIELVVEQDISLNQELQSVGLASLVAGLGSGMPGSQALPSTLLVHEIGGRSRLTGLFASLPAIAVLVLGAQLLSYCPKPVLGALLLYLGLTLLWQWLYQAWFRLPRLDYAIVVVMIIAIPVAGFLAGIALGFLLSVLWFMYCYSHVDVARDVQSGRTLRSNVERSAAAREYLQAQGEQILVLELRGFLFFGTATYLLNQVRDRVQAPESPIRFILLDFRRVIGLDASAVSSCNKILKIAQRRQLQLVFTNLSDEFRQQLQQGGGANLPPSGEQPAATATCQRQADLDRGLEWCEEQILQSWGQGTAPTLSLVEHFQGQFLPEVEAAQAFLAYLQPRQFQPGQDVFAATAGDSLYFVASGRISVLLDLAEAGTKRLQRVSAGGVLGEMRFYGKAPLSTQVVVEVASELYELTRPAFEQMQQEQPDLASRLEGYIIRVLCDSLLRREQQLRVMR